MVLEDGGCYRTRLVPGLPEMVARSQNNFWKEGGEGQFMFEGLLVEGRASLPRCRQPWLGGRVALPGVWAMGKWPGGMQRSIGRAR